MKENAPLLESKVFPSFKCLFTRKKGNVVLIQCTGTTFLLVLLVVKELVDLVFTETSKLGDLFDGK
jgi:hypothetical protein